MREYPVIDIESLVIRNLAEKAGWRIALQRASFDNGMFWPFGRPEEFIRLCGDLMPRRPRVTR